MFSFYIMPILDPVLSRQLVKRRLTQALITRLSLDPALPKEMKYELDRQSYSAYHHLLTLTFTDLGSSISWDL